MYYCRYWHDKYRLHWIRHDLKPFFHQSHSQWWIPSTKPDMNTRVQSHYIAIMMYSSILWDIFKFHTLVHFQVILIHKHAQQDNYPTISSKECTTWIKGKCKNYCILYFRNYTQVSKNHYVEYVNILSNGDLKKREYWDIKPDASL
jgi:hypothetical protein